MESENPRRKENPRRGVNHRSFAAGARSRRLLMNRKPNPRIVKGDEADIFRRLLLKKLDGAGSADQPGSEEINPGAVTDTEASKITAPRVTQG
jgi:hypothetical protein